MRHRALILLLSGAGLALAQTPSVNPGGVVNSASLANGQPVTVGSLVAIFGSNFASKLTKADSIPLSNSLGGVSVQFVNGNSKLSAPMLFADSGQLNVQIPWELVPGGANANVNVIVTSNGVPSAPQQVAVAAFSPGVYSAGGRGIVVSNSDGSLAWPAGSAHTFVTHPAKPGDKLFLYASGLGQVTSPPADGHNSLDKRRDTLVKPIVMLGGITANVLFSGLSPSFVGVYQVNFQVPENAPTGDSVPIQIQLGGITTSANITMAITQ